MKLNRLWVGVLFTLMGSVGFAQTGGSKTLTLEHAQKVAGKADAYARAKGWKISIAIVNSEGNLLYFQRNPEAYLGSVDASIQKAKSSNAFQRPTKVFAEGVSGGRVGLVTVKDIVAVEGGLPIVLDGKHAGSIGISGARSVEDEEVATAALAE